MFGRISLFFILLIPSLPAPALAAGLDDADQRLYQAQLALAEKGDAQAQYYLGEMHEQGLGTRQDLTQAFHWYDKAATRGNPLARRKLAQRAAIEAEGARSRAAEQAPPPAAAPVANPRDAHVVRAKPETDPAQAAAKAAAEKEKRRAAVRKMLEERKNKPVGELFD